MAIAGVIFYASFSSQGNIQGVGSFFSFVTALLLAGEPIRRLSKLHIDMATISERISMMYDVLDARPGELEVDVKPDLKVSGGKVEFKSVSFSYTREQPVIHDFSAVFPSVKMTALVGPSGGGKTTTLTLLQRFYLPAAGSIEIDGMPIDQVSLASLRKSITYLDQDAFLFTGTIKENIAGSAGDVDMAAVVEAAKHGGADDFVRAMPLGYDTEVSELSSNLSGGQRQRIALSRAFYKKAPILLLDEPTSALDSESENRIQAAILDLAEGKTTIVVAHRLSTIQRADLIYVIEKGQIVESGNHNTLMALKGRYFHLFRSQVHGSEVGALAQEPA